MPLLRLWWPRSCRQRTAVHGAAHRIAHRAGPIPRQHLASPLLLPERALSSRHGARRHREGAAGQERARHHHSGGGRRARAPRAAAGSRGPAVAPGERARRAALAPRRQSWRARPRAAAPSAPAAACTAADAAASAPRPPPLCCRCRVRDTHARSHFGCATFGQYVHHQGAGTAMGAPPVLHHVVVEQRVVGKKLKPEGWLAVCVLAFVFWPLMCVPCCLPACQEDVVETVYIAVRVACVRQLPLHVPPSVVAGLRLKETDDARHLQPTQAPIVQIVQHS